jgi:lysine 2,3-aminomutase
VPDAAELLTLPHELDDPTADAAFSPVKGVVHRYPDRALLKPLLACPVYCRFCFRREAVGPDGGLLSEAELEGALEWFAQTPSVREAILTGGDPLMLSSRRLAAILGRLAALPHIETLRIHTRVPVADPLRVTPALAAALSLEKPLYVCVHANHAAEIRARGCHRPAAPARGGRRAAGPVGAAARSERRCRRAGRPVPRHAAPPGEALLSPPAGSGPGNGPLSRPGRRGAGDCCGKLRGRVTGLAWPTYVQEAPMGGGKFVVGGGPGGLTSAPIQLETAARMGN